MLTPGISAAVQDFEKEVHSRSGIQNARDRDLTKRVSVRRFEGLYFSRPSICIVGCALAANHGTCAFAALSATLLRLFPSAGPVVRACLRAEFARLEVQMRLSLRFVLPLLAVLAAVAYGVTQLADQLTLRWFVRDLDARTVVIAKAVDESLRDLVPAGQGKRIVKLFESMVRDERLLAMGFCNEQGELAYKTFTFPAAVTCRTLQKLTPGAGTVLQLPQGSLHAAISPILGTEGNELGKLVLLHDMGFIEHRSADTRRYVFYLFAALGVVISLVTVAVAQISWWGWMKGMRVMLTGEWLAMPDAGPAEMRPVA